MSFLTSDRNARCISSNRIFNQSILQNHFCSRDKSCVLTINNRSIVKSSTRSSLIFDHYDVTVNSIPRDIISKSVRFVYYFSILLQYRILSTSTYKSVALYIISIKVSWLFN